MFNFDEIFTFDHLYASYMKCLKGVSWKQSTQNYREHATINVTETLNKLKDGTYKSKSYHFFNIAYRGKTRECQSIHISDRVVQKCLCDYCLIPLISKKLIYKNFACQKNKGVEFARKCFREDLRKVGKSGYCLLIDFKSYFDNIRHSTLIEKLRKLKIDERTIDLIKYLLTLYDIKGEQKGLALGSQMSQSFALYYASEIDNYVYHYKNVKTYGRYMDDIYILSNSKRKLQRLLVNIRKIASNSFIVINDKKTKIVKISNGITYLKRRYFFTPTNKLVEKINPDSIYRMRRKMNKNKLTNEDFKAWYNQYKKYDCRKQLNKLRKEFYEKEELI